VLLDFVGREGSRASGRLPCPMRIFHLPQGGDVYALRAIATAGSIRELMTREVPVNIRIYAPLPAGFRMVQQKAVPETLRMRALRRAWPPLPVLKRTQST